VQIVGFDQSFAFLGGMYEGQVERHEIPVRFDQAGVRANLAGLAQRTVQG
jgi:hypothetical protein